MYSNQGALKEHRTIIKYMQQYNTLYKKKKVEERNPKRESEFTELEMNKNSRNST